MKIKIYSNLLFFAFLFINSGLLQAQCLFNGLNPSYCTNSAASTLTPGITGGTFVGPGITGSVFNPAAAGPGVHTVTYSTCSPTYAISQPAFAPTSTLGTQVALGDDQESAALPIGFTFKFFCTNYTNFYISSNGFIEFALTGNGCCAGQALPNNTTPNNLIAYCWNDLNPNSNPALITYSTTGSAPNRTLTVSFGGVPYYSGGSPIFSQIRLVETSNIIEIHSTTISGNGNNATMGIENTGGTVGYPVTGRNGTTNWTATNDCYRWTPGVGCLVTNTTTVNLAAISITANNPICNGSTATLTANNNNTYTWSTTSNASSITVNPVTNTNYTVSGTNAAGCTISSVITVTVNNTITLTAVSSTGTNPACPGSPVTLSGTGANAYVWTGGITNAVAFNPTTSATYTVSGSNACGTASASISLSIHPIPLVTASANTPTLCSGSSVILTGGGANTYTWTPTAPNAVAFFPTTSNNYTVRGTSALGCTATAVQGITVITTPSLTPVVTPTSMCQGLTATLSASGATGYTWTPGTALNNATLTVSPPVTTNYTVQRTNGACAFTSTVNLVVFPVPILNASATPTQVCAGAGVNLVVTGTSSYTWLPGPFSSADFTIFPNTSNTFTVTGSNGSCTAVSMVQFSVNPSPVISIGTSTTSMCEGGSATLTANGALSYTWLPMNTNGLTQVVTPNASAVYTLSGTNSFNCTSEQVQLILVLPAPNMSLTSSVPYICTGDVALLSVANPGNNILYSWNTGSVSPSISVNPGTTTNYTVTGTNTISGCFNTNTITLSVFISTFVVSSPTALCVGSTATLTATGAATLYSWDTNGGTVSPSVTVSPVINTSYLVTGSNGGCQTTQSLSIVVNPLPNITAMAMKPYICLLEEGTLNGNGAVTYLWNTGGNTKSISVTPSVTTEYSLTGTDAKGCSKTATVTQYVETCIGVEQLTGDNDLGLNVYPNPNNGTFMLTADVNITLRIVNTLGQVVGTVKLSEGNKKETVVNNLPSGIYFIRGEANNLKVNKKIIVEK